MNTAHKIFKREFKTEAAYHSFIQRHDVRERDNVVIDGELHAGRVGCACFVVKHGTEYEMLSYEGMPSLVLYAPASGNLPAFTQVVTGQPG